MTPPFPRQIRELRARIKEIVDASDRMGFLGMGAPTDEYNDESNAVLMAYLRIGPNPEGLTWAIQDVFDRMFGPTSVPVARSKFIASRLFDQGAFNGSDQTD